MIFNFFYVNSRLLQLLVLQCDFLRRGRWRNISCGFHMRRYPRCWTQILCSTQRLIPEMVWRQMCLPRFCNTQKAFNKSSVRYSTNMSPRRNPRSYVNSDIITVKALQRILLYLPFPPAKSDAPEWPDWAAVSSLVKRSPESYPELSFSNKIPDFVARGLQRR